jgi:hypothetical protein
MTSQRNEIMKNLLALGIVLALFGCATTSQESTAQSARESAARFSAQSARESECRQITDQAQLARIAIEDQYASCRRIAVEKLTDQQQLIEIAGSPNDGSAVRQLAVIKD